MNNAGRSQRGELAGTALEVHREILDLNVIGPISLTTVVLPHMVKQKLGHLVVVSSITSKMGNSCFGDNYLKSNFTGYR